MSDYIRQRLEEAIRECNHFINVEVERNPELRSKEQQELLDFYLKHRAKLYDIRNGTQTLKLTEFHD